MKDKKNSSPARRRAPTKMVKNVIPQAVTPTIVPREVDDEMRMMVKNGLTEAILGFNPTSIGVQLSQVDTIFKNNRWYLISNMRQVLSEIYVEHGLVQTIIDVPVNDAFRGGVIFKSKQLSEEQLQELQISMDREEDIDAIKQARKWTRLFGGGGIIIITDQDPETELDVDAIKEDSPLEFRAVDMWELFWSKQNTDDYSAAIDGEDLQNVEFYDYYGQKVHRSRVIRMVGLKAPSFIRPRLRGWGFSVIESLVRSINQYLKSTDLVFEVLDEFKVDVYKIKNLANTLLMAGGEEKVRKRVSLANREKNYQHAITMDAEDDFDHKQLSFTGIAEAMDGIRMQIASDMRMPLTKVFGISAQGFNSGEDDIENYNAMVDSTIRSPSTFDVLKVAEIRCQKLFGFRPEDLSAEFKPLRMLTSEQQENVKNAQHTRLLNTMNGGLMTVKEFKDAMNKLNLLGIQIDTSVDILEMAGEEDGEISEGKAGPKSKLAAKPAKA